MTHCDRLSATHIPRKEQRSCTAEWPCHLLLGVCRKPPRKCVQKGTHLLHGRWLCGSGLEGNSQDLLSNAAGQGQGLLCKLRVSAIGIHVLIPRKALQRLLLPVEMQTQTLTRPHPGADNKLLLGPAPAPQTCFQHVTHLVPPGQGLSRTVSSVCPKSFSLPPSRSGTFVKTSYP